MTYKGEPVVIGGFIPGAELTSGQSDRVFASRDGAWVPLPRLNHARAAAGAAVVGDKIVVVGGQADGKLVPRDRGLRRRGLDRRGRAAHAARAPRRRLRRPLHLRGRRPRAVGRQELGDARALRPGERQLDEARFHAEGGGQRRRPYAAGRVFAVGGEGTTSVSDTVQAYDIPKGRWSSCPPAHRPPRRRSRHARRLGLRHRRGDRAGARRLDQGSGGARPLRRAGTDDGRPRGGGPPGRAGATQYAGATEAGGRVWLFGGIGAGENATTETAAYDRAINNWTAGPELPQPLHHVMAVTYKGEAVVIGGFVPGGRADLQAVGSRIRPARRPVGALPPLNHARAAAAAAVVGDKIVVVGGQADGKLVRETEVFDGESWKDRLGHPDSARAPRRGLGRPLPVRRRRPQPVVRQELAALERYDPASDSWTKLKNMPTASGSVGAAVRRGRLITVGGETRPSAVTRPGLRPAKQTWSLLPRMHTARHGVAVAALGDSLYAIGGAAVAGHTPVDQEDVRARLRLRRGARLSRARGVAAPRPAPARGGPGGP